MVAGPGNLQPMSLETRTVPDGMRQSLELVTKALEIVGAGTLVIGFLVASVLLIRRHFREGAKPAIAQYRRSLGRTILVGLEILVAATIIKTVTLPPTWQAMGFLAVMIAIRTFLGWTITLELYGHWTWQRPRANAGQ